MKKVRGQGGKWISMLLICALVLGNCSVAAAEENVENDTAIQTGIIEESENSVDQEPAKEKTEE